jgi:hypothetical protein
MRSEFAVLSRGSRGRRELLLQGASVMFRIVGHAGSNKPRSTRVTRQYWKPAAPASFTVLKIDLNPLPAQA